MVVGISRADWNWELYGKKVDMMDVSECMCGR